MISIESISSAIAGCQIRIEELELVIPRLEKASKEIEYIGESVYEGYLDACGRYDWMERWDGNEQEAFRAEYSEYYEKQYLEYSQNIERISEDIADKAGEAAAEVEQLMAEIRRLQSELQELESESV